MNEKNISIEKIKAILSMASMALLSIQHFVGILADNIYVSYIPLSITFVTIFISSWGIEELLGIKRISLIAAAVIVISGCIVITLSNYGIKIDDRLNIIYPKIMFGIVGVFSLVLSILYTKRIREMK